MKYLVLLLFIINSSCHSQIEIDNITDIPQVTQADKTLANVYKPLDGTWKGVFLVKQDDSLVKKPKNLQDKAVMLKFINAAKTVNTINVTQVYTSESPYFQKVSITDFYPDTGKTEQSKGVNKIQDGKMWCVVHKPSDTVIHEGSTPNLETIIWQSNKPKRIEYFYETVTKDYYEIIGYGYYNDDDTSLSPKLWFYGKYERQ
ncbi:hypothetical protein [Winogradskyella immobilis]|uniref:DUF1579 domain-containing protein n=1 Tax=Winogradskyella immobilis TaxID=2816852 RepID=A0ABS8ELN0_9FLAO|nr:hypothetical protein [Winogradskyella immobilis]MCC1484063.1 hypothetical protein [Winogradskyella immobilis]MCG0016155.1 hypothetical protein [Winogradskyella immobilis]